MAEDMMEILKDIRNELKVLNAPSHLKGEMRQLLRLEDSSDTYERIHENISNEFSQLRAENKHLTEDELNQLPKYKQLDLHWNNIDKLLTKTTVQATELGKLGLNGRYNWE